MKNILMKNSPYGKYIITKQKVKVLSFCVCNKL